MMNIKFKGQICYQRCRNMHNNLKFMSTFTNPLCAHSVRNITRNPQSAMPTPIRYHPAIRYLKPWYLRTMPHGQDD